MASVLENHNLDEVKLFQQVQKYVCPRSSYEDMISGQLSKFAKLVDSCF